MKALKLAATCVFGGVLLIAGIALAGQEKVDVCHITGVFDFGSGDVPVGHVIGIADPAYQSHLDHGDPAAWALVSDADGNEYCTAQVEPPPTGKLVFVTSETYLPNLGGLEGADAICQAQADTASLPGTYKAWLSSGLVDPTISPSTTFYQSTVPYVRVDDVTVADNWGDLVDGNLSAPINVDQNGIEISGISVAWTSTNQSGQPIRVNLPYDCDGFTSVSNSHNGGLGNIDSTDTEWTDWFSVRCDDGDVARLYCFQQ